MSVVEPSWLPPTLARPREERRFRLLAAASLVVFTAFLAATAAGAPREMSSLVFSILVFPVPVVVWWAYRRATADLRRPVLYCAWASTLWLAGSLVWYGVFLANGSEIPSSPGIWDGCFVAARLLLIVAVVVAMRSFVSVRLATLDAVVIVAAGVALGAAFVGHGLDGEVSAASLFTLNRPILSVVTLMLIASAALSSWEGLRRSVVLLGLGEIGLTAGSLVYSYYAVQGDYVDDRWANVAWSAGALFSILAACVVILRIDRPIRLGPEKRLPDHPAGASAVVLLTVAALAVSLGAAIYGELTRTGSVMLTGVGSSVAIGLAMALRARGAIVSAERSSESLDQALADSERARDELDRANAELQKSNAALRTTRVILAQAFELIDERTAGGLRNLVQDAGSDIADLVDRALDDPPG